LRDGLLAAREAVALLEAVTDPLLRETLGVGEKPADVLPELAGELARALVDRPPAQPKDGAVFRSGFDPDLDELEALRRSGSERMLELEARLREQNDNPR